MEKNIMLTDKEIAEKSLLVFEANGTTRELLVHFKLIADNKGLDSPQMAYQDWCITQKVWPMKVLKSGTVKPMGYQAGIDYGKSLSVTENKLVAENGIKYQVSCVTFQNIATMNSTDKAILKKAEKKEAKETGKVESLVTDNTAENIMVSVNAEMAKLAIALHKAGSNKKATKEDYKLLCDYASKVIASLFEVELTEA